MNGKMNGAIVRQTKTLPMQEIRQSLEGITVDFGISGRRTQTLTGVERSLVNELFALFSADNEQHTLENVRDVAAYLWVSFDTNSPAPPSNINFDWSLINRFAQSQMVATFGILALAFGYKASAASSLMNMAPRAAIQAFALLEAERRSYVASRAANAMHDKPDGSRARQKAIQRAWASGKYTSRDRCAEEECAALDMSFAAARRALRNTPDPT